MTEYEGRGYGRTAEEAKQNALADANLRVDIDRHNRDVSELAGTAAAGAIDVAGLAILGPFGLLIAYGRSATLWGRGVGLLMLIHAGILVLLGAFFMPYPTDGQVQSTFIVIFAVMVLSGACAGLTPSVPGFAARLNGSRGIVPILVAALLVAGAVGVRMGGRAEIAAEQARLNGSSTE